MSDKFEFREWEDITWLWVKSDTELWNGPRADWTNTHYQAIIKYCENFNVVVQAGGACGMYPRLLSNIFRRVYTFEPHPDNFYCLVHNCPGDHVVKFQAALGDEHKLVFLSQYAKENNGSFYIQENPYKIINHYNPKYQDLNNHFIPQFRIDDLALNDCNLIWLDIEGWEQRAINGAQDTIKKFNPIIILEYGDNVNMGAIGYKLVANSALDKVYKRV